MTTQTKPFTQKSTQRELVRLAVVVAAGKRTRPYSNKPALRNQLACQTSTHSRSRPTTLTCASLGMKIQEHFTKVNQWMASTGASRGLQRRARFDIPSLRLKPADNG